MIHFETTNSPFFLAHKTYCEVIESQLKTVHIDCSGWCNSYGYAIETAFKRNNLSYTIKFHKHQSTQNGVIIPVDATEYAGIEVMVTGLNKKFRVTIGKSSLRRLFISTEFKDKIPFPYFIQFNYSADPYFINNLVKKILDDNISKFKLSNGTLVCKLHTAATDPLGLIADIERTTKNWSYIH